LLVIAWLQSHQHSLPRFFAGNTNGYVWFYVVGDFLGKTNGVMSGPALQSPHFLQD
jgi:hypothetical protein